MDISGRKIAFGLAPEATRGVVAAPVDWVQLLDYDAQPRGTELRNDSALNNLAVANAQEMIRRWFEGRMGGKVTSKTFGQLLYAAFGAVSSNANADASGTVKDHVFTETNLNQAKTYTVVRKDPNSTIAYPFGMLKSLEINVVSGDFVKYTAVWQSSKGATTTTTVTYAAEPEFTSKHATLKFATSEAGLAGATALPVKSIRILIDRNLNQYYPIGSDTLDENYLEEVNVTGDMVLRYTDQTWENNFFGQTYQAMLLDIKNTDVTIGTAANPRLQIQMPRVACSNWQINQGRPNIVEQTVGLQGLYDIATAKMIIATLTNNRASY
jgi:hypothetical protein